MLVHKCRFVSISALTGLGNEDGFGSLALHSSRSLLHTGVPPPHPTPPNPTPSSLPLSHSLINPNVSSQDLQVPKSSAHPEGLFPVLCVRISSSEQSSAAHAILGNDQSLTWIGECHELNKLITFFLNLWIEWASYHLRSFTLYLPPLFRYIRHVLDDGGTMMHF
jgi:hypothetical protein